MEKFIVLLIIFCIVACSIMMLFYNSQIIIENLTTDNKLIMNHGSLIASIYLDPEINKLGVYIIQTHDKNHSINVSILDPCENEISRSIYSGDSIEKKFSINKKGMYKMKIVNASNKETYITHAFGYMPNELLFSFGIMCFYIIVIGLVGILICVILLVRSRHDKS